MSDRYFRRLRLALEALEDAGDRPLSYAELGALGVESPAQTVYELEIAGEPIVHTPTGIKLGQRPGTHGRHRLRRRDRATEGRRSWRT